MRIAVASIDGVSLSPALSGAGYLVIFSVSDDEISAPEVRALPGESHPGESAHCAPPGLVAFPAPLRVADGAHEGIPEALKLAVLDCDILLAAAFSEQQQIECRRLGILALAAPMVTDACLAVRWVVSGASPHEGLSCGECPSV